jgi:hypothetical protein
MASVANADVAFERELTSSHIGGDFQVTGAEVFEYPQVIRLPRSLGASCQIRARLSATVFSSLHTSEAPARAALVYGHPGNSSVKPFEPAVHPAG